MPQFGGFVAALPPPDADRPRPVRHRHFFARLSRSRISLSSSSVCWVIRSAIRSSFWLPDAAAACSTSCRRLSRRIAMRSSSSASDSVPFIVALLADTVAGQPLLRLHHGSRRASVVIFRSLFSANVATCCKRKLDRTGRSGSPGPFALDGPIDGVDQYLGLDEFDPGPLGLLAIEGCRQGFGEGVAVIGHSFARLSQCLNSLAHIGSAFCWSRDLDWRETQLAQTHDDRIGWPDITGGWLSPARDEPLGPDDDAINPH